MNITWKKKKKKRDIYQGLVQQHKEYTNQELKSANHFLLIDVKKSINISFKNRLFHIQATGIRKMRAMLPL